MVDLLITIRTLLIMLAYTSAITGCIIRYRQESEKDRCTVRAEAVIRERRSGAGEGHTDSGRHERWELSYMAEDEDVVVPYGARMGRNTDNGRQCVKLFYNPDNVREYYIPGDATAKAFYLCLKMAGIAFILLLFFSPAVYIFAPQYYEGYHNSEVPFIVKLLLPTLVVAMPVSSDRRLYRPKWKLGVTGASNIAERLNMVKCGIMTASYLSIMTGCFLDVKQFIYTGFCGFIISRVLLPFCAEAAMDDAGCLSRYNEPMPVILLGYIALYILIYYTAFLQSYLCPLYALIYYMLL